MEDLIWLLVPVVAAGLTSVLARAVGFLDDRRDVRMALDVAALVGLLALLLGPRCLCRDAADALAGAGLMAASLGAGAAVLSGLICGWRRRRQRARGAAAG